MALHFSSICNEISTEHEDGEVDISVDVLWSYFTPFRSIGIRSLAVTGKQHMMRR